MGDPNKQRKKYSTPSHPWQKARIEEEIALLDAYGLKNKKEIWRLKSLLKKFSQHAKRLIASTGSQEEVEEKQLLRRLVSLGIINENAQLEDVLSIQTKDLLERRLQTLVHKRGLCKSIKQARQFIVHRHITLRGNLVTFPSYLVKKSEEDTIQFVPHSTLSSFDHPERQPNKQKIGKPSSGKEEVKEDHAKTHAKTEAKKSNERHKKGKSKDKTEKSKSEKMKDE